MGEAGGQIPHALGAHPAVAQPETPTHPLAGGGAILMHDVAPFLPPPQLYMEWAAVVGRTPPTPFPPSRRWSLSLFCPVHFGSRTGVIAARRAHLLLFIYLFEESPEALEI